MKNKTDRERLGTMTDVEIEQATATDPDSFTPDASWMARAVVVKPKAKEVVTLRLDPDVLAWFRREGRGYQTRINAVLRAFVEAHRQPH
jgi:uncharacterized protein (DUF4415 family)